MHPLSTTLAELQRLGILRRLQLRGLTVEEVRRLFNRTRGAEVPEGQAAAVHQKTEGNPLFVREVLRYVVEEGLEVLPDGRWVSMRDGSPAGGIPEGLRDVIGKRLSRLSGQCNQVLAIAAVIGQDFSLETLQRVAGFETEALVTAIEEALHAGMLVDQSRVGDIRYSFAHALFRQT
jgi:predicted ATPase